MQRFSKRRALWIFLRAVLPGPKAWLTTVLALGVLMAIVFAGESACYPWAYSLTFGPTLTGTWVGELMPAVRGPHVVMLEVRADIDDDGGDDLSGTATLCNAAGESRPFGLTGSTGNWRGTLFSLTTYILENREGEGVQLGPSGGEWDTRDTLRITAHLTLFRIHNGGVISSTDRPPQQVALEATPVALTMRRGSTRQFEAACRTLRETGR